MVSCPARENGRAAAIIACMAERRWRRIAGGFTSRGRKALNASPSIWITGVRATLTSACATVVLPAPGGPEIRRTGRGAGMRASLPYLPPGPNSRAGVSLELFDFVFVQRRERRRRAGCRDDVVFVFAGVVAEHGPQIFAVATS